MCNIDKSRSTHLIANSDQSHVVKTYTGEFRNLMILLNNIIYLEGFGECGGQGRCATCLVEVSGIKGASSMMGRNEKTTIDKINLAPSGLRLACQILVTEDLNEALIGISEDGY
jgi:2Fe-2S ferredoxin